MKTNAKLKQINNLDSEITKIINRLGLKDRYLLYRIQYSWSDIVGSYLASHTLPQRLFNNELTIHTDSAGISSEIHFFQREIRSKLKLLFDVDSIKKIYARIGTRIPIAEQSNLALEQTAQFKFDSNTKLHDDDIIFISNFCKEFEHTAMYAHARQIALSYAKIARQKMDEGWTKCEQCGSLVHQQTVCAVCALNLQLQLRAKLRELLHLSPWSDYQDIRDKLIVGKKFFDREKAILICDLFDNKFRDAAADAKIVMLLKNIKPEEVTEEMLQSVAVKKER